MNWSLLPLVVGIGFGAACRARETPSLPAMPAPSTSRVEVAPSGTPPAATATSLSAELTRDMSSEQGSLRTWTFDSDPLGSAPRGFSFGRTGAGREGTWAVRADPQAASAPSVLVQADTDITDNRLAVAFTTDSFPADVELRVKCKLIHGNVDRACGLVVRLVDTNNYYLARANALEGTVGLDVVNHGRRQQLTRWSGAVTSGTWHDLRLVVMTDHFEVDWDGVKVIEWTDGTFGDGGRVGVWTKADSVTYFDNLSVNQVFEN